MTSKLPPPPAIERQTEPQQASVENWFPPPAFRKRRSLVEKLLLLVIVLNVGCLLYYVCIMYKLQFHSDSAVANLLAQEIYETGQYFPQQWNYANGDVWVIFMQAWIVPMLPFFKNGFALHAASSAIGCLISGIATWGLCSVLGMSARAKLVSIALLSAGFSPTMSEHMYGQQAYGTIYYMACALLYCGWNYLQCTNHVRWRWGVATALLIVLVVWANPQRGLIYYLLPLCAAIASTRANWKTSYAPRDLLAVPHYQLLAVMGGAFLIGFMFYRYTLAHNLSAVGPVPINWVDFAGMLKNAQGVVHGSLGVLSGFPTKDAPAVSLRGALEGARLLAGFVFLLLAPWALRHSLRTSHSGYRFLSASAIASLALSLFIFITTNLSVGNDLALNARYFLPGLMWAVLAVVIALIDISGIGNIKRVAGTAAIVILTLSAPFAFDLINFRAYEAAGGIEKVNQSERLTKFLEAQKLQYGYATYWNAGKITVLSSGSIKTRPILCENGLPSPKRFLSSNRWYEREAWSGPSFLMLTQEELAAVDLTKLFDAAGAPMRQVDFENYRIFVFDHNIANNFPTWWMHRIKPQQFPATADTPHMIGHFNPVEKSLVAAKGEAGFLRFGPYMTLTSGQYLVSFDLLVEGDANANFGFVDVAGVEGLKAPATRIIDKLGTQRITLPLTLDQLSHGVEFRVSSSGTGKITLFNVELVNAKRP